MESVFCYLLPPSSHLFSEVLDTKMIQRLHIRDKVLMFKNVYFMIFYFLLLLTVVILKYFDRKMEDQNQDQVGSEDEVNLA